MGEATFYAKLLYNSHEEAKAAKDVVDSFLKRVDDACNMWHDVRMLKDPFRADKILREEFPDVFRELNISDLSDQPQHLIAHLNYLAGELDSPAGSDDYELFVFENEVCFSGTVWHCASWDALMEALARMTRAVAYGYVSDEYVEPNYYDLIEVKPVQN